MDRITALFERARSYEKETCVQLEHIERLHRIAARIRSNPGSSPAYAEEICEKLARLENELNRQIDRTADAKRAVLVYLSFLEGEERAVIESYYLLGYDWSYIAEKLYMSERRVYLLRKSALKRIEEHFAVKKAPGA